MTKKLAGVLGPVVTTFDETTGELAPIPFRANVRAHLDAGLTGVVVAGSTGEAALLEEHERLRLLEWARAIVPDERWLIAGIGGESTRLTVRRAQEAAERGADAVLVVAPHYYGAQMTPEALATHFRRLADQSPLPVILYNIPKYVHFPLAAGLVHELAAHENVVGIKDSSGDLAQLGAYLEAQSERFTVLTGSGAGLYPAMEMGARGGVLAVGLFAAPISVSLWRAFTSGDSAAAGRAQERLVPLARTIVGELGVAGVKAALDFVGLAGGPTRPPLLPLRARERERVADLLRAAGLARAA
ncbi:MAG TPA: dihydrodipicolinate synthase family protein [Gemmatimonadaceae bacterium]|nr:dihydrodipicolinate synthase family protein [Gemmatimonadaceae bacterium]